MSGRLKARLSEFGRFARLYSKSKIGVIGLVVIFFFVIMALFSATLAPEAPLNNKVGAAFAVPSWATAIPMYNHVPGERFPFDSNGFGTQQDLSAWTISGYNYTATPTPGVGPPNKTNSGSLVVHALYPPNGNATSQYLPKGIVMFEMQRDFEVTGGAPPEFELTLWVQPVQMQNLSRMFVNFVVFTPSGANFTFSSTQSSTLSQIVTLYRSQQGQWVTLFLPGGLLSTSGITAYEYSAYPARLVFNESGTYHFVMQMMGVGIKGATERSATFDINRIQLHLLGGSYGTLGTDNDGNDVWAQLVWGSRISMMVGIAAGVGSVLIGAIAGVTAGYVGGLFGDTLGRVTDFFLVIPFLPMLIVITATLASNPFLVSTIYFWIILAFMALSWPFIAILIRAQTVSVKERQYVEASRALGGGTGHILRRHIMPNVMGLVYSQIALNVSGFILLDSALDFLQIGNRGLPVISWGIMLSNALPFAISDAQASYVWWWFLTPGFCIAALSLAFVLVGYALDSVFNPRLRAR